MNPKLLKERMRTKAQRPDIVVAYHNFFRHEAGQSKPDARGEDDKQGEARRTA